MFFHRKYRVGPNKITGWRRLVGQEVPIQATSDLLGISGTTNYGSAIANLTNQSSAAADGSPVNQSQTFRKVSSIVNGPQTPQATQPALDLWVPLKYYKFAPCA